MITIVIQEYILELAKTSVRHYLKAPVKKKACLTFGRSEMGSMLVLAVFSLGFCLLSFFVMGKSRTCFFFPRYLQIISTTCFCKLQYVLLNSNGDHIPFFLHGFCCNFIFFILMIFRGILKDFSCYSKI